MKRVALLVLIVVLLLVVAVGGVWAQKTDEEAEPTATLLSSTNTDDEGLGWNIDGDFADDGCDLIDD